MITKLLNRFIETYNINPKLDESGREDAAFELLSCIVAFTRSPFYAKDMCWNSNFEDGRYTLRNDDGKIDGYDIVTEDNKIIIKTMQSKHSSSISTSDIREFFNSVKNYIFDLHADLPTEFQGLRELRQSIIDTKNKFPDYAVSYELSLVCVDINETTRSDIDKDFNSIFRRLPNVSFKVITKPMIETQLLEIKQKIRNENYEQVNINIDFELRTTIKDYTRSQVLIGAIDAENVHHIINKEFEKNIDLSRLFSGNVRGFLGDTSVNLDIKNTIENATKTFLSKNNGAVIVCDEITPDGDFKATIKNPIIINGQQTFASIYMYANSKSKQNNIHVPVKVISIQGNKDRAIEDIAKASNQANEITELDLLANKPLTKRLKKYFNDRNIYLKVKDGELLNDILLKDDQSYDFSELLKIWLSVYMGRPNDSKFTKKNFELFNKAYSDSSKNKIGALVSDQNFEKFAESFLGAKIVLDNIGKIEKFFYGKPYYEHANYFILFLVVGEFGFIFEEINEVQMARVMDIVEAQIEIDRERKTKDNKEYTNNNYFKSTRPINDYLGYGVESITDKIISFFN